MVGPSNAALHGLRNAPDGRLSGQVETRAASTLRSERDVVSYLLARGLITPDVIVAGNLSVTNTSRRHRNYRVASGADSGLFLKAGIGPEKSAAIAREAAFLHRLRSQPAFVRYVPATRGFDEAAHIVVHELVVDAEDLREYHTSRGRFPTTLARAVGTALATLHTLDPRDLWAAPEAESVGARPVPWVLSLHRPTVRFYRECSAANHQLIRLIQEFPDFGDEFDVLREAWCDETLIHGDIKWDNLLAVAKAGSTRKTRIKIVDWEVAGAGDPHWDVGSAIGAYLGCWLGSIPLVGELPVQDSLGLARFPLEKMLPAIHALWDGYKRVRELDDEPEFLMRSIRFAAARLVQTAFEQMQQSTHLNAGVETMLQLSANILNGPGVAAVQLLGFDGGHSRA